jgi:L-threonylcarbamoyladenylate synthase
MHRSDVRCTGVSDFDSCRYLYWPLNSMTQVIQLDPARPQKELIEQAAKILRDGGLVAFPTETVYGLGADALNESAVRRVFDAKGRPSDNPCIVHVESRVMLDRVSAGIGDKAEQLIEKFWPGPLTLVLNRKPEVPPAVSAGLPTVAVRMPENEIALALIRAAGTPIAAPSANSSGRPSPTSAAHVLEDLRGRIELIIDGGNTNIGIESTVLDLTADPPTILRPGWVTREMLTEVIGSVRLSASAEELGRSPGTRHRHYSPQARVILLEGESPDAIEEICRKQLQQGKTGFIGHTAIRIDDPNFSAIILRPTAEIYAHSIYAALREMDQPDTRGIIVEGISDEGEGAAVMDRLRRAAGTISSELRSTL